MTAAIDALLAVDELHKLLETTPVEWSRKDKRTLQDLIADTLIELHTLTDELGLDRRVIVARFNERMTMRKHPGADLV